MLVPSLCKVGDEGVNRKIVFGMLSRGICWEVLKNVQELDGHFWILLIVSRIVCCI